YWQQLDHIAPRVVDDHAFHPVLVDDRLLIASSTDDSVVAFDLATGGLLWRYVMDAPVRFAPVAIGKRIYAGSDDGSVSCLALSDGTVIWQKRLAEEDRRIVGNGRIISPWPVRTGLVTDGHALYATCGLFVNEGVYAFALDPEDGNVRWKQPLGYSAQGYLLCSDDRLFVPTGRGTPIALRTSNGELIGQYPGVGGTYAVVTNDSLISGRGNDGTVVATQATSRQQLLTLTAQQIAVAGNTIYLAGAGRLISVNYAVYAEATRELKNAESRLRKLQQANKSDTSEQKEIRDLTATVATLQDRGTAAVNWEVLTPNEAGLMATRTSLVEGGRNVVIVRDRTDGRELWRASVNGDALGLACQREKLIVSTSTGHIYVFGKDGNEGRGTTDAGEHNDKTGRVVESGGAEQTTDAKDEHVGTNASDSEVRPLISRFLSEHVEPTFGHTKGFCIALSAADPQFICELARATEYQIAIFDRDLDQVSKLRQVLLQQQWYGTRVTAHHVASGPLPLADYLANVVIAEDVIGERAGPNAGHVQSWERNDVARIVRPSGGLLWEEQDRAPTKRGVLPGAGQWVHQYGDTGNTATTTDERIRGHVRLQWFGGPGPAEMVDRHLRGPAPLAQDGLLFVPGENLMLCVDAYHGT
ncbi:MAG: PQQ-binding-like beta-propeller repeat protein, partial [Planctomycetales bacterium]|nr:PQQ-binding-like beta-propeller repeat protein [Planctomycetales bacterium]